MSRRVALRFEHLEDRTLFAAAIAATLPPMHPVATVNVAPVAAAPADPTTQSPLDAPAGGTTPEVYPPGTTDPSPDGSSPSSSSSDTPSGDDNYPLPPTNGPAQHASVAQPPVFTLFLPLRDAPALEPTLSAAPPATSGATTSVIAAARIDVPTVISPAVASIGGHRWASDVAAAPEQRAHYALDFLLDLRTGSLTRADEVAAYDAASREPSPHSEVPAATESDVAATGATPVHAETLQAAPERLDYAEPEATEAGAMPAESRRRGLSWIPSALWRVFPLLLIVDRGIAWFVERRRRVNPTVEREKQITP
jgi:hypothetical protein